MKKYKENLVAWLSRYEINDKRAIVFLLVSVLVLFSPLLFFGKILLSADSTYLAYPSAYFFGHFFGSPISPFLFSGYPMPVAFEYGYFHPLYNLFYYFFDFLFAYHSLLFLDFLGAGIFTYLFTRKIGLSSYASILASTAYTFSQLSVAWLGVPSVANAVFLLPAVLYCMFELANSKIRYIFIFGLILGLAFLGTHYQFIVIALIGGGAFFLFEMWQRWNKKLSFITNFKPFFWLSIAFFIALIISLPQALSSLTFFGQSTRQSILVYSSASYLDLFRYFIPTWNLPFISLDEFRPYIGVAPLFFALVGVYAVYRKKIVEKRAVFFFGFFIVTLIMSLQYSPFLFIIKHLPLIKYFAVQSRWMYLANFALIVLSAFGFDFVLKNIDTFPRDKVLRLVKKIGIFLTVFFVAINATLLLFSQKLVLFLQNYFDSNLYEKTTHLPIEYYHDIIEIMAKKVFLNVSFSSPNVILFLVFIFGLYGLLKLSSRKVLFSNLVVLFVLFNMLTVSALTFDLGKRSLISERSNMAEFINAREGGVYDYRVFGFAVPFAQYQKITAIHPEAVEDSLIFAKEALVGNLNAFSEIPIVGGYNPMAFRRYQDIVTYLEDTTAQRTIDEKISLFLGKLNLLSALNVKYVVSPYELKSDDLTLVFSEKVTSFNVPLYLYENKKVLSRFYLAKNVTFLPENDESGSFAKITGAKSDFKNVTFIECDNCVSTKIIGSSSVTLISESDRKFEVDVKSDSDQWLVLSNQAVPGWQATVDGNPARIYYTNHAHMAVSVPKGEHKVVFSYSIIPIF